MPSRDKAVARRIRRRSEKSPARSDVVMGEVACNGCGERFEISHNAASQDAQLAERQAQWLQDQFVWDHIQENKHPSSIPLPAADQMK